MQRRIANKDTLLPFFPWVDLCVHVQFGKLLLPFFKLNSFNFRQEEVNVSFDMWQQQLSSKWKNKTILFFLMIYTRKYKQKFFIYLSVPSLISHKFIFSSTRTHFLYQNCLLLTVTLTDLHGSFLCYTSFFFFYQCNKLFFLT